MVDIAVPLHCPWCNEEFDVVQPWQHESVPKHNSMNVCASCTMPSVFMEFAGKLTLRLPSAEEAEEIEREAADALALLRQHRRATADRHRAKPDDTHDEP